MQLIRNSNTNSYPTNQIEQKPAAHRCRSERTHPYTQSERAHSVAFTDAMAMCVLLLRLLLPHSHTHAIYLHMGCILPSFTFVCLRTCFEFCHVASSSATLTTITTPGAAQWRRRLWVCKRARLTNEWYGCVCVVCTEYVQQQSQLLATYKWTIHSVFYACARAPECARETIF